MLGKGQCGSVRRYLRRHGTRFDGDVLPQSWEGSSFPDGERRGLRRQKAIDSMLAGSQLYEYDLRIANAILVQSAFQWELISRNYGVDSQPAHMFVEPPKRFRGAGGVQRVSLRAGDPSCYAGYFPLDWNLGCDMVVSLSIQVLRLFIRGERSPCYNFLRTALLVLGKFPECSAS